MQTLLIWSAQVVVLVAAAVLASLTISHPKGRLLLWQGLLAMLMLLPVLEPWKAAPALRQTLTATIATSTFATAAEPSSAFQWRAEYWLWLIAAGAALRMLWVAAGFLRLRRYRQQARPLGQPPLRFACAVAAWYASDSVSGPVTYGWRRPVILLPSKALELPAELREAIECHELIHVRRNDWLWVLAETLVRSVLWFHPAVWFVVGRIQLTREQVVDREAVELLRNRERYLDALVAVAGYQLESGLAPAFLKKRHLAARVDEVMKEIPMLSRTRILAATAAAGSLISAAVLAAMWLFPFVAPPVSEAQTAPDGAGITVSAGATLLHRAPVHVPAGVSATGTVAVEASLDTQGNVTDARVISGPQELRKEALSSVLQWHYQPGPASAAISIEFGAAQTAQAPSVASSNSSVPTVATAQGNSITVIAPRVAPPPPPPPPAGPTSFPATLKAIQFLGVSSDAEQLLRSRLPFHEGDTISQADIANLRSAFQSVDSHLAATYVVRRSPEGTEDLTLQVRVAADAAPTAGVIRQSAAVQSAKAIKSPAPVYPSIARQARIQGDVTLAATIGTDGTVQSLTVVTSTSPLLTPAAMDAVKHWVYQPTILNGQPVAVSTMVDVSFRLPE